MARLLALFLLVMLTSCSSPPPFFDSQCHFVALTDFRSFSRTNGSGPGEEVWTSPELAAPFAWDELVLSWNAVAPPGTGLKFEARGVGPDTATGYYVLGLWSEDPALSPRTSVDGQKDAHGDVQTDTLILRRPADRVQVRVTFSRQEKSPPPELKCLGLSFLASDARLPCRGPNRRAWGRTIAVPERSQLAHRGGWDWCSPTCVSMVLAHWAAMLGRPELDIAVPRAAAAIHDPQWGGTGNWPFNTAYAGSFRGMRAFVARARGLPDIEDWIVAGVPPVLSVSSDLLHGQRADRGRGHLMVCVGFTEEGDVVVNDPWADLHQGERVRRVYPRGVVARAWTRSRNAAYFIYPQDTLVPLD